MAIRVDDIGTVFRVSVIDQDSNSVDLSSLLNAYLYFGKPDGTTIQKTPYIYSDSASGILQYVTQSGDINMIGLWSLQAKVEFSGSIYNTAISTFRVERNI